MARAAALTPWEGGGGHAGLPPPHSPAPSTTATPSAPDAAAAVASPRGPWTKSALNPIANRTTDAPSTAWRTAGGEWRFVTSGSGTNSSTRRHTFYEETFPVAGSRRIRGGHLVSERVSITAPDLTAAPMSLERRDNAIRWKVTVGVDIQDWPDYEQDTVVLLGD